MDLDALHQVVNQLRTDDWSTVSGAEVIDLLTTVSQLESVLTRAVGEFDTWGEWVADEAKGPAQWITATSHGDPKRSRRLVRRARALRRLPETAAAFDAGDISADHVDKIAGLRNPRSSDDLDRDEGMLAGIGTGCRFGDFRAVADYWLQLADPDGCEVSDEEKRNRRSVTLHQSGGMFYGSITLDPVSGTIVNDELARIEDELFKEDWEEAKERLGRDPTVSDLRRTIVQRRADAAREMAIRSAACRSDARRPAPLFTVLVDYNTLAGRVCELANGCVLAPGTLLPWLEVTDLERAVFGPDNRIEISTTTRFFTGATRRALEIRDRRCVHPFCDEPVERCQADHIEEHAKGGPTTQQNGRLLCALCRIRHNWHYADRRIMPTAVTWDGIAAGQAA